MKLGPEKDITFNEGERKIVAYHMAGHAIFDLVHKVAIDEINIEPRNNNYSCHLNFHTHSENIKTYTDFEKEIISLLMGRAAEDIMLGRASEKGQEDFKKVKELVQKMVTKASSLPLSITPLTLPAESDVELDVECRSFVSECLTKAKTILNSNKKLFNSIVQELINNKKKIS
ncbi:MAG: hypothetical protein ACQBVK_03100 [Candidatus Phytoplasma sp. TWB_XP]